MSGEFPGISCQPGAKHLNCDILKTTPFDETADFAAISWVELINASFFASMFIKGMTLFI